MIIEIVPEAAYHLPERIGPYKGHGAPDLIPPKTLINIPETEHKADNQDKSKK